MTMNSSYKQFRSKTVVIVLLTLLYGNSCKKLIDIDPPPTSINQENVYKSDATAISALTGIYATMSNGGISAGYTGAGSISVLAGLSADELTLYSGVNDNAKIAFYKNSLVSNSTQSYGHELWVGAGGPGIYSSIFRCNAAIEGLSGSTTLTPSVKQQLLGEAKFMRAFFYFYLVNLYGDAPLVLSTDPNVNATLARTPKQQVYQQMIIDLKEAQELLSPVYLNGSLTTGSGAGERVRPTKWAAAALLARVYLYTEDYVNAEAHATTLINQTSLFSLPSLNNAFLKNSTEAIWQLQPVRTGRNTEDAFLFIIPATGPTPTLVNPVYLSPSLLNSFEANDQRKVNGNWINSVTVFGITYYFPYKYKETTTSGLVTEYLMMFRLAEQYLIRAEARAQLNNIPGAQADLNAIRTRAGLGNTIANDKSSLLAAILKERQVELFTEFGHRWLDLKRTNTINTVMAIAAPQKGTTWNPNWQLYPLPFTDIQRNPNLVQNPGY